MKVVLFGASGMVGQGVQRELLLAPDVEQVISIVRRRGEGTHDKLRELEHADFTDFAPIAGELAGSDTCCFCLGVSAAGLDEASYARITHDFALAAARTLLEVAPNTTFIYVSGAGTDSSEKGRQMWARVKGKTENELLVLGFARAVMFRPGMILPRHGAVSKTTGYRIFYGISWPLLWAVHALAPSVVTSTEDLGLAMLEVARHGSEKPVVTTSDIHALAVRARG